MLDTIPRSIPPPSPEYRTGASSCTLLCTSVFVDSSWEKVHLVQSAVCATASFPANVHNTSASAVLSVSRKNTVPTDRRNEIVKMISREKEVFTRNSPFVAYLNKRIDVRLRRLDISAVGEIDLPCKQRNSVLHRFSAIPRQKTHFDALRIEQFYKLVCIYMEMIARIHSSAVPRFVARCTPPPRSPALPSHIPLPCSGSGHTERYPSHLEPWHVLSCA